MSACHNGGYGRESFPFSTAPIRVCADLSRRVKFRPARTYTPLTGMADIDYAAVDIAVRLGDTLELVNMPYSSAGR
jgi:hypothetical protein